MQIEVNTIYKNVAFSGCPIDYDSIDARDGDIIIFNFRLIPYFLLYNNIQSKHLFLPIIN